MFKSIKYKIYNKIEDIEDNFRGIKNIITFKKVLFRWRWWDYSFTYDFILALLKELEKHWGRDTHYIGDKEEKDKLTYIVKKLEELQNKDDWDTKEDIDEELGKVGYKFFKMVRSLWD